MLKKTLFAVCTIFTLSASANDSIGSEFSHFLGGGVMAGAITAATDQYYPEYRANRASIGFYVSSGSIVFEQAVEYMLHGDAKGQALDAFSHIVGSAIGACITDEYFLAPVVDSKYTGLSFNYRF